jgi:tripartite-type tricarboxylate transporter receptor subunit TctC
MISWKKASTYFSALIVVGIFTSEPTLAQASEPFYQDKTLTFMVAVSAGGSSDIECRLYARYLPQYLAGNPTIVVRNRAGAGGILAINWLYERGRRDGTVVLFQAAVAMYQEWYAGNPQTTGLRANMTRIIPVVFIPVVSVGTVRKNIPPDIKIEKPEDILKAKGWVTGGFRTNHTKDLKFRTILDLVGAQYKYATGYPGSADLLAAFMRKEIDYVDGSTAFFLSRVKPVIVDTGQAIPIWYDSLVQLDQLAPAYNSHQFVEKLTGEKPSGPLWDLFQASRTYRMLLFPPEVPQKAVKDLQKAFRDLHDDPNFLAEYKTIVGIQPTFITKKPDLLHILNKLKNLSVKIKKFRGKYIEKATGRK